MKEDGVWIAGNTGLLYRFNRSNRTMTLLTPDRLADPMARYCHMQTQAVFATNNYEVL
jgi:hypothetical protein